MSLSISVKTFGADRCISRWGFAMGNALALQRGLQLRNALRLPVFDLRLPLKLGEGSLQTFQHNEHHCDVVESLLVKGQLHYVLSGSAAELMEGFELSFVASEGAPYNFHDVRVAHLIEDAVTRENQKVVVG